MHRIHQKEKSANPFFAPPCMRLGKNPQPTRLFSTTELVFTELILQILDWIYEIAIHSCILPTNLELWNLYIIYARREIVKISTPTCIPLKKSTPFFNLTLDCLLNLQEKYYQSIHFGARCKLEPKRVTRLGICFDAELHYSSWIILLIWDLIKNWRRTSFRRKFNMKTTIFLKMVKVKTV
jgi:hypothetical protein